MAGGGTVWTVDLFVDPWDHGGWSIGMNVGQRWQHRWSVWIRKREDRCRTVAVEDHERSFHPRQ